MQTHSRGDVSGQKQNHALGPRSVTVERHQSGIGSSSRNLSPPKYPPIAALVEDGQSASKYLPSNTASMSGSQLNLNRCSLTAAEEELKAERLMRMMREFERMDTDNVGMLTPEVLANMARRQDRTKWQSERDIQIFIVEVNKLIGQMQEDEEDQQEVQTHGIAFTAFAELMLSDEEEWKTRAGPTLAADIKEIRDVIFEDEANQLVAQAAHIGEEDLSKMHVYQKDLFERRMDIVVGTAILVNAVTIGLEVDYDLSGLKVAEYCFCGVFTGEIVLKLRKYGALRYFFGADMQWNLLDVFIVGMAWLDMMLTVTSSSSNDLSKFTLIRLIRIGRLARLIRLMSMFKQLTLMVVGLVGGLRTLFWAIVLLAVMMYAVAVLLTVTVGKEPAEGEEEVIPQREELFSTVPISMFTIFRCLTDGCSDASGRPIMVYMQQAYGPGIVLAYMVFSVIVWFGLFNLIMAIFVEDTLQAARKADDKISNANRKAHFKMAARLKRLVRKFCVKKDDDEFEKMEEKLLRGKSRASIVASGQHIREILQRLWDKYMKEPPEEPEIQDVAIEVSRSEFRTIIQDTEVQVLLNELDVPEADRDDIFDVLDADGNGRLELRELVQGILKIRGQARRSDVVGISLAVRSLQSKQRAMESMMMEMQGDMREMRDSVRIIADKCMSLDSKVDRISKNDLAVNGDPNDAVLVTSEENESTIAHL
eukprot:gnl/MRDRNA2_/MRDRNA2_19900_c0_seq1.p1 gnl/MRDRNA2_/MRDRNA2_19900_c0~~gnl/MRDRNA2_/MRDRNA2_19900_c0_seq1.p1  ORF type:complete len:706 (-),score=132.24 gnl/MRDRNA2_/MRDRNA2_19900_c0_seq1:160-2277(-)